MTTLATLLIILLLVAYGLKEYYQVKLKTRPNSTPKDVQNTIIDTIAEFSNTGRFIDLGSGWGGMVLHMAKKLPEWQIDGVEASPTPWFVANCRSIASNSGNYRFFIGTMQKQMLQSYDVIFLNQPVKNLQSMLPRLVRALQNDTLIITYPNPLPRIPDPKILTTPLNNRIYMYLGIDAVAFMNPEPAPEPMNPVAEPADETVDPIPTVPNDDNAFEQAPVDSKTDFSAQEQAQGQLPLNQTD